MMLAGVGCWRRGWLGWGCGRWGVRLCRCRCLPVQVAAEAFVHAFTCGLLGERLPGRSGGGLSPNRVCSSLRLCQGAPASGRA